MKKKMLIFAHYYIPDVASTGQLLQDLAEGIENVFEVTVICTVPSYTGLIDEKYKNKQFYRENINGVNILRVPVSEFTKSSKKSRIKNLLLYYLGARKAAKTIGYQDYIFTISQPPILGGMLGVYGKKKLKTVDNEKPKMIYCIQDFNPEQIEAVGYFKNKAALAFAKWLDKRSCRESDLVVTVGRDLCQTLEHRFKGKKIPHYVMINNWINEKEIYPLPSNNPDVLAFKKKYGMENEFIIMYSGNIGLYYDLEELIKVIEQFKEAKTPDGRRVVFTFVGAGSVLETLMLYKQKHKLDNVVFIPYQEKDKLIYSLNAANVHWCINAKGIKGVSCPSKAYGIMGVGKPMIGVLEKGSEIRILIEQIGCGKCCEPGDYAGVSGIIRWYIENAENEEINEMGRRGRVYLETYLTKDKSIKKYIEAIGVKG